MKVDEKRTSPYVLAYIVRLIVNDTQRVIPVSAIFAGEYALHDLAAGVPAVIGGRRDVNY